MISILARYGWLMMFAGGAAIHASAAIATAGRGDLVNALSFAFASGLMTCALIERLARCR